MKRLMFSGLKSIASTARWLMKTSVGWAAVSKSGWLANDSESVFEENRETHHHSGASRFDFFAKLGFRRVKVPN
jgi:hypothetical protein